MSFAMALLMSVSPAIAVSRVASVAPARAAWRAYLAWRCGVLLHPNLVLRMAAVHKVALVAAVAYKRLVFTSLIFYILCPVMVVAPPWARFIYYHFIGMVYVVVYISWWQAAVVHPIRSVKVNVLSSRYIIVNIQVGHIIILNIVISNRAPNWLRANVHIHVYLGKTLAAYSAEHYRGCQ